MGTRATISVQLPDNTWLNIWVKFDGYLEHMGQALVKYYNTYKKALELVECGAIEGIRVRPSMASKMDMPCVDESDAKWDSCFVKSTNPFHIEGIHYIRRNKKYSKWLTDNVALTKKLQGITLKPLGESFYGR